ncbi:MAG: type II secretion system secretin GspD [Nitrospirae bacterium]|nr:type II secretion system secretin GspD [Nitrospirota bacterium]
MNCIIRNVTWVAVLCLVLLCSNGIAYCEKPSAVSGVKEEKVVFNFVAVELPAIAKFVSELTGKNVIFDEQLKGKITIVAPSPISKADAFRLFTSVLELKGYTVMSVNDSTYKIIPSSEAKQKNVELSTGAIKGVSDTFVARLIHLEYLSADDAVKFLRPIVSKDGYIGEFNPRNVILVVDTGSNIEKILSIVKRIDLPSSVDQPDMVVLKHANAETLAKILNEGMKKGQKQPNAQPATSNEVQVVADKRLNAIIIFGAHSDREVVKKLIDTLDVRSPEAQGSINVYFLENASAVELARVLDLLLKKAQPAATAANAAGERAQAMPFSATGDILITPDEATNSLVIVAPPSDYRNIVEVIKKLDRKRKQVYVEAMIVEVSINGALNLGANWRAIAQRNGEPVFIGGVGTIDSTAVQNILSGVSGLGVGGMGNFLNVPVTTVNSDGTTTTSSLSVPGYAALFNMDVFKEVVNVLSAPQILTSDNKEAEIIVGENVPFISKRETGSTVSTVTGSASLLSSIDRKDVGITLKITPHITEGDYLKLETFLEISSLENTSNTQILITMGPTTTKRSTKTTIYAKAGETVVIGGLIQDKSDESETKVPILGDIPLLGYFFKQSSTNKSKINLMVFLTPHIINDDYDLKGITKDKRSHTRDILLSHGRDAGVNDSNVIVRFKDGVEDARAKTLIEQNGCTVIREYEESGMYLIKPKEGLKTPDVIHKFESVPEVRYAESESVIREFK